METDINVYDDIRSYFQREELPYHVSNNSDMFYQILSDENRSLAASMCSIWSFVVEEVFEQKYEDYPLCADENLFIFDDTDGEEKYMYTLEMERKDKLATYYAIVFDGETTRLFLGEFDKGIKTISEEYTFVVEVIVDQNEKKTRISSGPLINYENKGLEAVSLEKEYDAFVERVIDIVFNALPPSMYSSFSYAPINPLFEEFDNIVAKFVDETIPTLEDEYVEELMYKVVSRLDFKSTYAKANFDTNGVQSIASIMINEFEKSDEYTNKILPNQDENDMYEYRKKIIKRVERRLKGFDNFLADRGIRYKVLKEKFLAENK